MIDLMKYPVILCVDDERVILDGLQAQLSRQFGKEYEIEIAESGEESLDLIEEFLSRGIDLPVIISDQVMPDLKGHELLEKVHSLLPHTLKILLTGHSDMDAITEAVNKADLYRYISKPWNGPDLMLTIKEALKSYYQNRELEVKTHLLERQNKELEQLVGERTKELNIEKEKTEALLHNILPVKVAKELMETGKAKPARFDEVSILFSDFIEFTNIVATIPTKKLIHELNEIFSEFDDIMEAEGVEKIQTVGDAYLAACGLPVEVPDHARRCVRAAQKMIAFLKQRNKNNAIKWEVRIGIHSGPISAGVVGKKKFAYDIFGDTINIASRIESAGEAGKINLNKVGNVKTILLTGHVEDSLIEEIDKKGNSQVQIIYKPWNEQNLIRLIND